MPVVRTIAIINQKGGVGKTTTTANLAAGLARRGKNICMLDLDPQSHLTLHYGVTPTATTATVYDILAGESNIAEPATVQVVLDFLNPRDKHIELPAIYIKYPAKNRLMAKRIATVDAYRKMAVSGRAFLRSAKPASVTCVLLRSSARSLVRPLRCAKPTSVIFAPPR